MHFRINLIVVLVLFVAGCNRYHEETLKDQAQTNAAGDRISENTVPANAYDDVRANIGASSQEAKRAEVLRRFERFVASLSDEALKQGFVKGESLSQSVAYDVKATDSLVTPFTATVTYHTDSLDDAYSGYKWRTDLKWEAHYAFQNDKWICKEITMRMSERSAAVAVNPKPEYIMKVGDKEVDIMLTKMEDEIRQNVKSGKLMRSINVDAAIPDEMHYALLLRSSSY